MELTPPTAPLPPFWAAVRRREPDVDLVLLPDEAPQQPGPVVDDAAVREVAARVTDTARALTGDPAAEAGPAYGPVEGTVVLRARTSADRPDGRAALDEVRRRLEADGWETRSAGGPLVRLAARRDDLRLRASYAERTGAFLLEVESEPLAVGADRARDLVRR